jgi:hypothetical protein
VPESFDYAIVRVVPRVERGEFVNGGVIVACATQRYLAATIALDADRLRALDASVDLGEIEAALAAIPLIAPAIRAVARLPRYRPASDFTGWSRRAAR